MVSPKVGAALRDVKPVMALVLEKIVFAGVGIVYKLAFAGGMKVDILVFYRMLFAAIAIAPLAFLIERNTRPKMTWKIACQGLAIGFLGGALGSNTYAACLTLTTATVATSMTNTIPALTLLLAVIFRMERIEIRRSSGKAKVIGTALGLGGAMILTLYEGMTITLWSTKFSHHQQSVVQPPAKHNHVLGCLLALLSCIIYATWLLLQTKMSQGYPHFSSSAFICFTGAIISGVYALCRSHSLNDWKLGFNFRLLAAGYMGIIGTGFETVITAWGTRVKGPLFVASFTPLGLVFVALLGSFILGEKLTMGSMIGSVFIIVGLYTVLWGKSKDTEMADPGTQGSGEGVMEKKSSGINQTGGNSASIPGKITGEEKSSETAIGV